MRPHDAEVLRNRSVMRGSVSVAVTVLALSGTHAFAEWPQWGGPNRNFTVETSGLADTWPEDGPGRIWHRAVGDGYSSIVYDDGMLYTMYRKERTGTDEYTIALDAKTGNTAWEHANPSPLLSQDDSGWGGQGPNSTPLIVGNNLYTVGSRAMLHCFDKRTGQVRWKKDLVKDLGAPVNPNAGYAPSPIAYRNLLILPVGRDRPNHPATAAEPNDNTEGQSLVAVDQSTGEVVWKALGFAMGESSPILIRFDGQDQLVCTTVGGLIGVDPDNGRLLWQYPRMGSIVTPVWNGSDMLFYSSGGDDAIGGVVKLTKNGAATVPELLWVNQKIRIWQPTPVRIGDYLYGATSRLMLCVNMKTGKRVWAKRGFPMASCVYGDGKLIILDQDGRLTLATATPEGLAVHSQCKITERYSFTVPTLVGTTLYVRDRSDMMALDLSASLDD